MCRVSMRSGPTFSRCGVRGSQQPLLGSVLRALVEAVVLIELCRHVCAWSSRLPESAHEQGCIWLHPGRLLPV